MPKQTRWEIKRGMDQSMASLDSASFYLVREGARFEGTHDDYYQQFAALVQAIEKIKAATQELRDSI